MVHDTKRGVYYLEAYFKNEPNNRYEINLVEIDNKLLLMAYDKTDSQITDEKIAKYIKYNVEE